MPIQVEMPDPLGISQTGTSNDIDVVSLPIAFGQGDTDGRTMRVIIAGDSVTSVAAGNTLDVRQVSGANWSVIATATDLDIRDLVNATDSMSVYQVSGANWSVEVASQPSTFDVRQVSGAADSVSATQVGTWTVTVANSNNTTASNIVDSTGVVYSGSNPIPITWVSGAGATVGAANIDSSGVQYSGSNPMPAYLVLGSGNSTISVGPVFHDAVDDGAAPQKIGGTAMTTNPTAVSDGGIVRFLGDKIGRQIVVPYQVRDLVKTAYVSLTTGTETTLLAGVAGVFFDLISLSASTTSTFGVTSLVPPYVDIRCTRTGGIVASLPVSGLSATNTGVPGFNALIIPSPIPQDEAGSSWTADLNDITGTTVNVQALFIRNI